VPPWSGGGGNTAVELGNSALTFWRGLRAGEIASFKVFEERPSGKTSTNSLKNDIVGEIIVGEIPLKIPELGSQAEKKGKVGDKSHSLMS